MKKLILFFSIFSLNIFAADTTSTEVKNSLSREEMRAKIEAFKAKCEAEIVSLCEEDKGPETMRCMIDNYYKIADSACKALVKEAKDNPPPRHSRLSCNEQSSKE